MYVFTRPLSFGFRYAWLHARPPFSCQNWGISIFRPSSLPQISWVVTSGLANLIPAIISFVLFPRSLDCFLPVEVLANASALNQLDLAACFGNDSRESLTIKGFMRLSQAR